MLNLKVVKSIYDYDRPYKSFKEEEVTGSGFIFTEKGLVLTNARLVVDSISIVGRSEKIGKKDLSLEVVGICREKELAICKIVNISLLNLSKKEVFTFSDSMKLNTGHKVFTLNPSNTGIISTFNSISNNKEDSLSRKPVYIKTNFKGTMGSPLLNYDNKVVGIFSENDNVIPSRTFFAVYHQMLSENIIKMPTLSFDWCETNRELMKKQTGTSSTYGIYVRKIYPDSCLDSLEKGDVIRRIDYVDLIWNSDGTSKSFDPNSKADFEKGTLVTVFLDRFGMTTTIGKLKNPNESDENKLEFESKFTDRKLELSEVVDMIPIGTVLTLNMCRDRSWYKLKTEYVYIPSDKLEYSNKPDFEIFGGICVSNLNIQNNQNNKNLYKKQVIINQVFPDTYAYKTQSLKSGQIIKTIFGYNSQFELIKETHRVILSLEDVRYILSLKPDLIQITTTDETTFIYSNNDEDEDKVRKYRS